VGILATGLFDRLLGWAATSWDYLRSRARLRHVLAWTGACAVALALGLSVPPAADQLHRWVYGCDLPTEVRVLTSTEQLDPTRELAAEYERWTAAENHGCPTANLYVYGAGTTEARDAVASGWLNGGLSQIGPRPDVWLPDSSLDVADAIVAGKRYGVTLPIAENRTIAFSPLVLGVPAAAVPAKLGDMRRNLVWNSLWKESKTQGWDVVRPDPAASVVGVLATSALYTSLAGTGQALADPTTARATEQRIERSLDQGRYPLGVSSDLLCRQRAPDASKAAIITTEQALVRFNQGLAVGGSCTIAPSPPLPEASMVIFYPPDTVSVDHPFVRFNWIGPVGNTSRAAADFGAWLDTTDGKRALLRSGLRPPPLFDISEPLTEKFGALPGVNFDRRPPVRATVDPAMVLYAQARRPGRVLLALDASGSMQTLVDRGGKTRFRLAADGVQSALGLMSGRDEFGLRIFPADGKGVGVRELVPLGRSDVPIGGTARRQAAADALAGVKPAGGTPLFATIVDGVKAVAADRDDQIASLVVLTDGNDNSSGLRPADVDAQVRGKGVRVFVVAIGEATCGTQSLRDITAHSGGACYDAGLDSVDDVLAELFGLLWGGDAGHGG
jgi:hypothetical protein